MGERQTNHILDKKQKQIMFYRKLLKNRNIIQEFYKNVINMRI